MEEKTADRTDSPTGPVDTRHEQDPPEPVPTHRNTSPRGNPEPDRHDLERSQERLESLLGR